MSWDWETFPEYMDALEKLPRTVDVACHVPHGAVRAYVLGDREKPGAIPTDADIAEMSRIVEEGIRAGALGFSTSRTVLHLSGEHTVALPPLAFDGDGARSDAVTLFVERARGAVERLPNWLLGITGMARAGADDTAVIAVAPRAP